jgi:hypothetical protein
VKKAFECKIGGNLIRGGPQKKCGSVSVFFRSPPFFSQNIGLDITNRWHIMNLGARDSLLFGLDILIFFLSLPIAQNKYVRKGKRKRRRIGAAIFERAETMADVAC